MEEYRIGDLIHWKHGKSIAIVIDIDPPYGITVYWFDTSSRGVSTFAGALKDHNSLFTNISQQQRKRKEKQND